ncbi:hypothetical protein OUZ56_019548 [Daphnia magna]|uniref:RING-type domain-containing protein n=1 Tax=Daphnia magna TaxID=35525 RepID=A0ABQ9ZCY7_9CRUS|nr:hypothetical protein OUZ56_019548 [Daphnia magna]
MSSKGMSTHPVQVLPFHNSHYHSKNVVDGPVQPNSQKSTPSSNSASQRALRSEALRLATFQGWPLEYLSPRELSRAGFFYRGLADQTQCAFCCITISQWEPNDDPMAEHRRHAPNCPFVLQLSVGNIPLSNNISGPSVPPVASSSRPSFVFPSLNGGGADTCSRFQNESRPNALPERVPAALTVRQTNGGEGPSSSGNLSSLSLVPHQQARRPELTSLEARLNTFGDWPPGLEQRPPQLAEAGFYYMKTGDHVKCFCCDGALRNWEPKDDPWVEHARWFSRCNFLVSVKGNDYIKEIQARYQQNPPVAAAANNSVEVKEEKNEERKEVCSVVQPKEEASGGDVSPSSSKLRDALLCQICYDQQLSMVFLPCGHSMSCPSCATALTNCPLCRKRIEATVRAFFPFS